MTPQEQAEIVARWLGWEKYRPLGVDIWLDERTEPHSLDELLTGNGMVEIFEKMRKQPEEVRQAFARAIAHRLKDWAYIEADTCVPMLDELTPTIVVEAAAEVVP